MFNFQQNNVSGLLFGVTEDDIAVLSEEDFNEVWSALGKVALARVKAKRQQPQPSGSDKCKDDLGIIAEC